MNKLNLKDYSLLIPENLIALEPTQKRDLCKLLYYNKKTQEISHDLFKDIINYFKKGDILVINNTKVDPIRLYGKDENQTHHEVLILKERDSFEVECKIKGRKKLKIGDTLTFSDGSYAELTHKYEDDNNILKFFKPVRNILENIGELPLPQYIINKRAYRKEDLQNYQTIFADIKGSKAAPTAGLHFTNELFESLINKGVKIVPIQLFVSLGTFQPIQTENILDHPMHQETYQISKESVGVLNEAIKNEKKIVALGTTSLRTLESNFNKETQKFQEGIFHTKLYLKPGDQIHTADALITNFHTPQSTLLVLVATLIGYEKMQYCYQTAIEKEYRFFSYGDACFFDQLKT